MRRLSHDRLVEGFSEDVGQSEDPLPSAPQLVAGKKHHLCLGNYFRVG